MIDLIVDFLSGSSPYHAELRTFGQAFMGALAVRSSANKNKDMNWFHAFAFTTITALVVVGLVSFGWDDPLR